MEKDRGRSARFEQERQRKSKKIVSLIRKVSGKYGKPFGFIRRESHSLATPITTASGRRFVSPGLTILSWTETTRSYGVGSDDIASFARQTEIFEIREGSRTVFSAKAFIQSNRDGGPLQLTVDPNSVTWYFARYQPGSWERNVRRLASQKNKSLAV